MNINVNNGIAVEVSLIPKKIKSDQNKYCIYMGFYLYQNGVKFFTHTLSSGTTVSVSEWSNGTVVGRSTKTKLLNERFMDYQSRAITMLNSFSQKNFKTCNEVLEEIKYNAKRIITGKAPRGLKDGFISKLREYTYEQILNRFIDEKKHSKDRVRNYHFTVGLLNEYFENEIPNLNLLTTADFEGLKVFVSNKYSNSNTANTFLAQIAAVIKYAIKLKIVTVNPIPENFRGSFKDGNRQVLSESDCLNIMGLDDNFLTKTEQVAKYCLLVQMLTGIGYGDLQNILYENIKFSEDYHQYLIEKARNKTGVKFIINLTNNAMHNVNKLKELTGNEKKPFNIPSLSYSSRLYKKLSKKAGVKTNISTYTLRHTFAVNFMENDGRLEDLKVRLGHSDIKTTQIYGKISAKRNAITTEILESKSRIHQIQTTKLKAV